MKKLIDMIQTMKIVNVTGTRIQITKIIITMKKLIDMILPMKIIQAMYTRNQIIKSQQNTRKST